MIIKAPSPEIARNARYHRIIYQLNKVIKAIKSDKPLNTLGVDTTRGKVSLAEYIADIDPVYEAEAWLYGVPQFEIFASFTSGFVDNWNKFEGVSGQEEAAEILERFNDYTFGWNPEFRTDYFDTLRFAKRVSSDYSTWKKSPGLLAKLENLADREKVQRLQMADVLKISQKAMQKIETGYEHLPKVSFSDYLRCSKWGKIKDRNSWARELSEELRKEAHELVPRIVHLGNGYRTTYCPTKMEQTLLFS